MIANRMPDVEMSGYWWLPNEPDEQLGGTLTFTKRDGARLDLLGSFGDLRDFLQSSDSPHDVVHGHTTEAKKVTLVDCHLVHSRIGGGVPTQTLKGTFLVVGGHIDTFEDSNFTKLSVRFSNLEDWLGQSGISHSWPRSEGYTLTYKRPTLPRVRIPGGTVRFTFGFGGTGSNLREAGIREQAAIELTKAAGFSFRDATREFVWPMQNLLTLLTMEPSDVVELHVGSGDHLYQVYYQSSVEAPERDKPLLRSDMLVDARRLGKQLPGVLRRWLVASAELSSVLSLYFAVMSGRWMFLESRFLNVVQAAEVFHRYTHPNEVVSKAEHRKRVKEILEVVPEQHRKWLQGVLNFSNEPRLANRLRDVVASTSEVLGWTEDQQERLVETATRTRHYLTHYDPKVCKKALRNEELYWLAEMFRLIVATRLLQHVEVPRRLIAGGVRDNQTLQFARARWEELNPEPMDQPLEDLS